MSDDVPTCRRCGTPAWMPCGHAEHPVAEFRANVRALLRDAQSLGRDMAATNRRMDLLQASLDHIAATVPEPGEAGVR